MSIKRCYILNCRLVELRNKEVISCENGCRIGCVDDLEVDTRDARVCALVIYGRLKFFGLLGRKDDCIIPWENIKLIGEDTILVNFNSPYQEKRRKKGGFPKFF
ncbi:MAG: YlmC/YmxH family sporulation protein [Ruminococcus sp.]|nr:YlmC/YmxH family sporulation protein [Ruminococcus sp.]